MPGCSRSAGDLGLQEEPGSDFLVVGVAGVNLLQGHVPVKLLVAGNKHLAQSATGVRPQDLKAGRAALRMYSLPRRLLRGRHPGAKRVRRVRHVQADARRGKIPHQLIKRDAGLQGRCAAGQVTVFGQISVDRQVQYRLLGRLQHAALDKI